MAGFFGFGARNVTPGTDDEWQQFAMQRRMALADSLRKAGQQQPNGQMVGDRYVANPWAGINNLAGSLASAYVDRKAMDSASQYATDKRARLAQALAGIGNLDSPEAMQRAGAALAANPETQQLGSQLLTGGVNAGVMDRRMTHQEAIRNQDREDERVYRTNAAQGEREWRDQQARQSAQERADLQRELKSMGGQGGGQPYFTPIYTPEGVFGFNARSGSAAPVMGPDGKPLVRSTDDPALTRTLSGAKAGGKAEEEARTNARLALPGLEAKTSQMIKHVSELKNHPGMSDVVGVPNVLTLGGMVPGSKGADFRARLDQVKGGTFLQAFETLKGGGQITEVEGKKATDAIARMQTAQSEDSFRQAADEFEQVLTGALERSRTMAGAVPGGINPGAGTGPKPGTVEDGHRFKGGNPADPNNWEVVQ